MRNIFRALVLLLLIVVTLEYSQPIDRFLPTLVPDVSACTTCNYLTQWGSGGSGDGQFNVPYGVAVDSSGNVYIADLYNNRVEKFSGGVFSGWAGACTGGTNCAGGTHSNGFTCTTATCTGAGTTGSGDGQFNGPWGVAIDSSGSVYVTDYINNRVEKFSGGVFSGWAGACTGGGNCVGGTHSNGFTCTAATCSGLAAGSGDGQFTNPIGVAVDSSGYVYVTEGGNNRVQKFTSSGTYATQWGSLGESNGDFNSPVGVAIDSSGNVYVADSGNYRVQKFTSTGTYLSQLGCSTGKCSYGSGKSQFTYPWGVAVDSSGNVYVTDYANNRVQKFTGSGTYVTQWGSFGSGNGQFRSSTGIAIDLSGNVYVADSGNDRIEEFGDAILNMISGFASNASGQVLIVLGDFQIYPHGTKPPGVGFQSGRDTTPVGFISGMLTNPQPTVFDTNTAYVNSSTGRPLGSFTDVFVVGGPLINAASYYYQHTSVVGDEPPVSLSTSGSNYVWTDRNGTVALTVPQSSDTVPPGNSDVFTIEVLLDSGDRLVVLMFGTTFVGTWAAAYYFKYILYPNIGTYANGYYLIRWTDATSGSSANGTPDMGDTWTILATSVS